MGNSLINLHSKNLMLAIPAPSETNLLRMLIETDCRCPEEHTDIGYASQY